MNKELKRLLKETSKLTQDIGHRIGSNKNSVDDLSTLSLALESIINTLDVVRALAKEN